MSFYDRLDSNKTVQKAKAVLSEYARFIKIVNNSLCVVENANCSFGKALTFSNYISADTRLVAVMNRKDKSRSYEEIYNYINDIQSAIDCLKTDQIEILNMKYVNEMTNQEIATRLSADGKIISERQVARRLRLLHVDFAIAYGVYVVKKEKSKNEISVSKLSKKT
ncbi:hypothetical protein D5266_06785 [bacterium c-19]|nr:hypothetical protein [bacterium c-19]